MKSARIAYTPHPKQQIIHKALRPYLSGKVVMVIAGRRFGKTVLAINEIIRRAIEIPGSRIWYVAPTKDQAYRIAWRVLFKYLPTNYILKKREDRHSIELTNGSLIELLGVQDEIFLLGAGLHFVVLDEFPTIPYSVWFDVIRPMLADYNGDALFIGSVPDPKVHNISMEFIEMFEEMVRQQLFNNAPQKAFTFSSLDNPYINHQKIQQDIEELKRKGREGDIKRIYYGGYTREYGRVFPMFNWNDHTVDPFPIPGNWVRVMAIDPHPQKPIHAVWCAINPNRELFFYREKAFEDPSGRPLTVNEAAVVIRALEGNEKIRLRLIDPTFAKVEQKVIGAQSVVDQFKALGLVFQPGNRDFMTFFEEMTDRLKDVPAPTVHIFRSCSGLIRQLEQYSWDSYNSSRARSEKGMRDRPKPVNDDFISCVKYIVNAKIPYYNVSEVKKSLVATLQNRWKQMTSAV